MHSIEERLKTLFLRGLQGDARRYHQFLDKLSAYLRGYLRKRLYNLQDHIEDIVQETLLAVHNARHTYRADQPLTAWVHAIARYKMMDFFRTRARNEGLNDALDDYQEIFANTDVEPADAQRDIGKLLALLPERQRVPIMHVKLQGLSVSQTAQVTGLSESAVKIGIHRGLKALAVKIRSASWPTSLS